MIYLKDGNIPLNLAYDDDIAQEANSTYQLSFKFPLTDGKWNLLRREVFLLADDLHGEQEFFIFEVKKANGYVQVYAKQVATLLNYYSINSISVDRVPGQTVMTALAGSIKQNCPFTFFSDIMDRHTFNESNASVMDALAKDKHSIVGQWGGDLVRDKYQVKLLKNGGIENESLFMYKKNLSSYEESENINNLKTRLHLKKTIQGQSEGEADRVIAVTVDSPLIGQYRQIYETDIEVNDQDVTDEDSLLAYGQRYFGSTLCDLVENSINLDVKGKSDVSVKMFDTVSVFHERFDVDLRLKITSYHFAPMSKRLKSIGFGKVSQTFGSTVASMVAGSVDKATGRLSAYFEQKLQKEIDNANRHFDAEFEKRVEEINDGIEQSKAEAEAYADNIKQQIDGQLAESDRQYQLAQQNQDRQIADVLAKTTSAKEIAEQTVTDLMRVRNAFNQSIGQANTKALELERSIGTIRTDVMSQAQTILAQAQTQTALTNRVTTVETLADGTRSTVAELSRTVQEATQNITSVTNRTRTVEDTLSQTRTQYEALTQTVNTQTGQIDSINRKTADLQSGIDGVTERFESLQVGGRNYIRDFGFANLGRLFANTSSWKFERVVDAMAKSGYHLKATCTGAGTGGMVADFFDLRGADWQGKMMTFAVDIKCSKPVRLKYGCEAFEDASSQLIDVTTGWKRYTSSRKVQFNRWHNFAFYLQVGHWEVGDVLYIRDPQLEDGNIATTPHAAEEDLRSEIATYKRTAEESSAELSRQIQLADGKAVEAKTYAQQTATQLSTRLSSLETYKDSESTRASQYLTASREETARQLEAERTLISANYVAKSTYTEDARGTTQKLNEIKSTADTTKQNLATYQNTVDGKLEELTSSTQSLDGRINTASAKITQNAQEINKRLTSTQVESAITGKGYQTKSDVDSNITGRGYITSSALQPYALSTTVQNLVQETADSFSRTISETRALIPTSVSHRNLIAGTSDRWGAYQTINANSNWVASLGRVQFGDSSGIYAGSKVHLYVHVSADEITFDPAVTTRTIKIQGPILNSQNVWVWANSHLYHPFYNKWSSNLTTGNNYRLIKLTSTITQEMYQQSKGFELQVRIDGVKTGKFHVRALMVSTGDIFPDYWTPSLEDLATVTALHSVRDTVSSHTRTISALDGSVSQVVQTATGILSRVGTLESNVADKSSVFAVQNQVSQLAGSWAVQNLTSSGQILNQFNLLANGTNRIDGRLTHITGQTLIDNGVINNAMIGNLDAGKITTGYLASARIATNSITGSHMVFDQAFVNKMTANEALFKQLFAQSAFITSVQAVTMSAGQIVGGVLKATNGAAEFDLNNAKLAFNSSATIEFNSSGNALIRKVGDVTGFLHFNNATAGGTYVGLGVTSHNEGVKSQNTGRFAGIRIFRSNDTTDQTEIYGDKIYLGHGFNGNGITITATKLSTSYELVDVINSIRALWRCWLHWNGTGWNPDDMAMRRSVINEYNTYNIG
ncbi:phage tail spike protein [Streptococcus suis]|uniref:phage tail spike protein n=1 Tax=Streptococcus suis TaxID=1307 RepID=UPI002A77F968|nr:phage tail spike protein [Streptococcus suis]MDY7283661.1 phage tail spike protein [Streptococcus suis]HEL1610746.1 phage tail protein [Streptococcus suis]